MIYFLWRFVIIYLYFFTNTGRWYKITCLSAYTMCCLTLPREPFIWLFMELAASTGHPKFLFPYAEITREKNCTAPWNVAHFINASNEAWQPHQTQQKINAKTKLKSIKKLKQNRWKQNESFQNSSSLVRGQLCEIKWMSCCFVLVHWKLIAKNQQSDDDNLLTW